MADSFPSKSIAFFERAKVDSSIAEYSYEFIKPTDTIGAKEEDISLRIRADSTRFIDLKHTYLCATIKVLKDDGTNFKRITERNLDGVNVPKRDDPDNEYATFIDNILYTMWSKVDIKLKDTVISTSDSLYPYKAYLDILLKMDANKKSFMHLVGHCADENSYNKTNPYKDPANTGHSQRFAWTRSNRPFYMRGPLLTDITQQDRILYHSKDLVFDFNAAKDDFRLMMQPVDLDAGIRLVDFGLNVARVKLQKGTMDGFNANHKTTPVQYPFVKTKVLSLQIPRNSRSKSFSDVFDGAIPFRMVFGLVDTDARNGQADLNPFYFEHANMTAAKVKIGNRTFPEAEGYEFDFASGKFVDAYETLLRVFSPDNEPQDLGIDREAYLEGLTLIPFILNPGTPGDLSVWGLPLTGALELEIKFPAQTTKTYDVIVYASFPGNMEIDNDGEIAFL